MNGVARWLVDRAQARALGRRAGAWAKRDRLVTAASIGTLALFALTPWPALAFIPLAAYAALAWLRLDIALCMLPLTFPYWYVPKSVVGHLVFPLSEIALGVCAAVALGRLAARWITGRWGGSPDLMPDVTAGAKPAPGMVTWARRAGMSLGWPLAAGAGVFVLGATLSLLAAVRPHEALRAYRWEIVEPLLYLALLLGVVRGRGSVRWMVWALLASAGVVALLAIVQVTVWPVVFTPLAQGNRLAPLARDVGGVYRATGIIFGSGNSLGAWMERALPLGLALIMAPRSMAHGMDGLSRRARLAAGGLCLACLLALIWSGSRGAWVGALAGVALVACLAAVGRPWLVAAVAAVGGAVALWLRGPLAAVALGGHGGTGELRTLVWLAAWHMLRDHPLLGIGLDQFVYLYSNLYTAHPYWITSLNGRPTEVWREPTLAHPHNLALDLWLSVGVLGLMGFVVVVWALGRRCWRLWRAGQRAGHRSGANESGANESGANWAAVVALGVMGSMLAGLVHGMVDSAYFLPDLALVFWWSVGLVLLAGRLGEEMGGRSSGS